MMGIYVIAIMGGVTLLLVEGFGLEPNAKLTLQAIGSFVCVNTATMLIFAPKIGMLKRTNQELFSASSQGTSSGTSMGTSSNDSREEELTEKLAEANAQIEQLQQKIKSLEA